MRKLLVLIVILKSAFLLNAQWIQTNGPLGGPINGISIHENQIFASKSGGGLLLFVSSNNGVSWLNKSNGLKDLNTIAKLTFINNRIIALGSKGTVVSTDNGDTWVVKNNILTNLYVSDLIVKDSLIFAAASGIYLSSDFGETWLQTKDTLNHNATAWCFAIKGDKLFVGFNNKYNGGVRLTTDNGESWKTADTNLFNIKVIKLAVKDTLIFAGTYGGLFVSNNDGDNWQLIYQIPSVSINIISYDSTRIIVGNNTNLYLSINNGSDWNKISKDIKCKYINDVLILKDVILVATSLGIYKSIDNGNNWELINTNIPASYIFDLKSDKNLLYAGTEETGIFSSSDNGANWTRIDMGFNNTSVIQIAIDSNKLLVSTLISKELYFSDNMGVDWKNISKGINANSISSCIFFKGKIFVRTSGAIILFSENNGETWERTDTVGSYGIKAYNDVLYSYSSGIRFSLDGNSWNDLSIDLAGKTINNFGINASTMITQVKDIGFYLSTNSGKNWKLISEEFKDKIIHDYFIYGSNILINIYEEGVFLSQDYGKTWIEKNKGLSTKYTNNFASIGDSIFLGTAGAGVFKAKLSDITGVDENTVLSIINLCISPNPARDYIDISGSGSILLKPYVAEDADIRIYNVLGECVKKPQPSPHQGARERIDVSDLPAGLYLVRCSDEFGKFIKE